MARRKDSPGRGGARAGAGRKSADGLELVSILTIRVDQVSLDLIMEKGNDNPGAGVRRICHELLARPNPGTARAPTIKVTEKTAPAPKTKIKLFGKYVDV